MATRKQNAARDQLRSALYACEAAGLDAKEVGTLVSEWLWNSGWSAGATGVKQVMEQRVAEAQVDAILARRPKAATAKARTAAAGK